MQGSPFNRVNGGRIVLLLFAVIWAGAVYAQQQTCRPGDTIRVRCDQVPALTNTYQVAQDGTALFPGAGSLKLEGLSPQEAADALKEALVANGYPRTLTLSLEIVAPEAEQDAPSAPGAPRKLQAGDVLAIQIAGEPTASGQFQVQQRGVVNMPMVGEIQAQGLTVDELTEVIRQRFGEYVVEPVVRVGVISAVPQMVSISGHVGRPGLYPLNQAPTVLSLLAAAGGILPDANLSAALIYRDGTPHKLAPEGLTEDDQLPTDPQLRAGDVVIVPRETRKEVRVVGAVQQPGAIPLEHADSVVRAVLAAGGPTDAADAARAYVVRGAERINVNLEGLLGDSDSSDEELPELTLQQDDLVVIPPSTAQDPVYVLGAVTSPGPKLAKTATMLSDAIATSGGATPEADLAGAYLMRQSKRIDLQLKALLEEGDSSADIALEPGDALVIPQTTKQVYVAGQVIQPGAFPSEQAKTLLDLWSLVGTATPAADLHNCTILRGDETISVDMHALINQGDMSQNVALESGDKLIVPEILDRVYVLGAVGKPGPYPIHEKDTLMDIIGRAGGVSAMADIEDIALMRRGGMEPETAPDRENVLRIQTAPAGGSGESSYSHMAYHHRRVEEKRAAEEEARARPEAAHVELLVLAEAEWKDQKFRPQAGDVIFVPQREAELSRRFFQQLLMDVGLRLLVGGDVF